MDLQQLLKKLPFKKVVEPIGLDIGSSSIKVVKLSRRPSGAASEKAQFSLEFCGQLAASPTHPDFIQALHDYLETNKLAGLPVASSFDDQNLKIRKIEVASMPEADLLEAIRWKMRDLLEGNPDDYIVRYSLLEERGTAEAKRLVLIGFMAPREAVKNRVNTLLHLGLKPMILEPNALSLAACVERVVGPQDKWLGAVDLGYSKSSMAIMGHGKFHFSRPLSGIEVKEPANLDVQFNQRLAAEIQHTLDNFSITFQVEKLDKVFLAGGGAGVPGIADYLTKNLAIETEILNPFNVLAEVPSVGGELLEKPYLFTQAMALAMI